MKKFILVFCVLIFVSLFAFIFFFNPEKVTFNYVTIPDKFSISIPEYLSKTNSIDTSALLQYKNEQKQLFIVVYEEPDTAHLPLADFFKKFTAAFMSKIAGGNLVKYFPKEINGRNAFIGNIRGG